jgi:hypothetical protein
MFPTMLIRTSAVLKVVVAISLGLMARSIALAQLASDSPVGISAGFAKLFGNSPGFSATADAQVLDARKQEALRTPMRFQFLPGKMRMDIDLTQARGKSVTPIVVNSYKQAGLDRVASIFRLDKKNVYLIFSGVRSYVRTDMTPAEAEAAEKNLQVQRALLSTETLDGHSCTKNKTVVRNPKGGVLLEAITWNATDLKDFPIQIQVQSIDKTTILHFTQIDMTRPKANEFEPPAGYTRYSTPDALVIAVADKQSAQQQTNGPAQKPPTPPTSKPKNTTTKK